MVLKGVRVIRLYMQTCILTYIYITYIKYMERIYDQANIDRTFKKILIL